MGDHTMDSPGGAADVQRGNSSQRTLYRPSGACVSPDVILHGLKPVATCPRPCGASSLDVRGSINDVRLEILSEQGA